MKYGFFAAILAVGAACPAFNLGSNTYIADFEWVNPERVLISTARKFGTLDTPALTGNLYGVNVDGSQDGILVGQDAGLADPGGLIASAAWRDPAVGTH